MKATETSGAENSKAAERWISDHRAVGDKDLPHLKWALNFDVDPDALESTHVSIQSGYAGPHTTICYAADKILADHYHCIWWNNGGQDYNCFSIEKFKGESGWSFLRAVLEEIERKRKS